MSVELLVLQLTRSNNNEMIRTKDISLFILYLLYECSEMLRYTQYISCAVGYDSISYDNKGYVNSLDYPTHI